MLSQHCFFVLGLLLVWVLPVQAQTRVMTAADRSAIREVITQQLEAFRQDNAAGAFALTSPGIQAKFQTAERFLRMVRTSYPAVYRPQQVVFRDLEVLEGQATQEVLFVGPDGVPVRAFYPMEPQPDGTWKTDGCYLAPVADKQL